MLEVQIYNIEMTKPQKLVKRLKKYFGKLTKFLRK